MMRPGETEDQWRERMREKGQAQRRFEHRPDYVIAQQQSGEAKRTERPSHCHGCAKPLRSSNATLVEAPNTVQHFAKGYCKPCTRKMRAAA